MHTTHTTGLFFGSFNPIHIGHLILAEYFVEHTDLKEVWFVVSPLNPLKSGQPLLDARERLHIVKLAVQDDSRFKVCDIEFSLPQPSYTCRTLAELAAKYPKRGFALMMGSDSLQTFDKWLNYEYIIENYPLYVYPRKGFEAENFSCHPHVHRVDAPVIGLSATAIRDSLAKGLKVRYMLPPKVCEYLDRTGLYEAPAARRNAPKVEK